MDISVLCTPKMIMMVNVFSLAWFVLGILTGRYLPKLPPARGRADAAPRRKNGSLIEIYVGNLPYETGEKDLAKAFQAYGEVASARVISNRFTGKSRGFGFIEMADRSEAEAAIRALNGKDMRGRKIVVNEAK